MFVPIKVTTEYSMIKSLITVPKLMKYLKSKGIKVCGICDNNLYGIMEFYLACQENQIKPLIGLEVTINEETIYLYAKDYQGYKDLLKIHTFKEKKILSISHLEMLSSHINVVLPYSFISSYDYYKPKFSHLFIGYSTELEKNNAYLLTNDVVYSREILCFTKEESSYLNVLEAIDKNISLRQLEKKSYEKNSFEEASFLEEESLDFINSIDITFPSPSRHIPKYDENIKDSFAYLAALANKGLKKRMQNQVSDIAQKRLNHELSVIQKMGFSDYFLIVYDYVYYAKKNHILVGVGRGSAVGSLVSYCLGITDVNPLEYNLLFERFLNPERVTMPDIDIDFEETRRGEVVEYVKQKYGLDKVAGIMTFGTLKSKLVLKSVGKAFDIHSSILEEFLKQIDSKLSLEDNLQNKKVYGFIQNNEELKKVYKISMKLEGLKKHISTHAAGIVMSSLPLDDIIPVHYNGGEMLTGVTMNYLEDLGLLKMDFLSLRNLSIIASILNLIKENTGKLLNLNKINLNDPRVMHLFEMGDTTGVFQFESIGMKHFLRRLKPKKFLDLALAIALFRPGPMQSIDTFIKRKEGKEKVTYLHEDLKDILSETYGIIIYQEQVMQILRKIGGFSFAKADTIRRAMSKKKKSVIDSFEEEFILGALKQGYDKNLAKEIYSLILKFANYGFNKSHSVSYAIIGYQMAYLKCYFKIYYIANLLNMNEMSQEKVKEYVSLGKREGITFKKPDINKSNEICRIEDASLRLPLTLVKSVSTEAIKQILTERKKGEFQDFIDFAQRCYGKSINKKTIENLIHAGCFDLICKNHRTLLENLDSILNYATLANGVENLFLLKPVMEEYQDFTIEEKEEEEIKAYGFYFSNHPSSAYQGKEIMKLNNIELNYDRFVKSVVLIDSIREIKTKNKEAMAFVHGSDETKEATFVVFPSSIKEIANLKKGDFVLIEGRVARRMSDYQINVSTIKKINRNQNEEVKE